MTTSRSSIVRWLGVITVAAVLSGCASTYATNIGATVATLHGLGSCPGSDCYYRFQWGLHGQSLTNATPERGPFSVNTSNVYLSETITGLQPYTTYDFQFCGKQTADASYTCVGPDGTSNTVQTFSTLAYGSGIQVTGPPQTVFDGTSPNGVNQKCDYPGTNTTDSLMFSDISTTPFRDANGNVQLLIGDGGVDPNNAEPIWRMIGPSLDSITPDCSAPVFTSDLSSDPSTFANHEWLHDPYTVDGKTIYAEINNEFHGWDNSSEYCNDTDIFDCWYDSLGLATSTNGGATYTHAPPPQQLMASVPYQYADNAPDGGAYGYFSGSNIVKSGAWYYKLFDANAYPPSDPVQLGGTCVMRTQTLGDPTSWRAWNGTSYSVQLIDPYVSSSPPAQHVCQPVSPQPYVNVTWNTYLNRWVAVGAFMYGGEYGFYYATSSSPVLADWSSPTLMVQGVLPLSTTCQTDPNAPQSGANGGDIVLDPALIDPASTSRSFETTGQTPDLYYTQVAEYAPCNWTLQRDLVRIPIRFP